MKKIIRCVAFALAILLAFSLCGCTALVELLVGAEDYRAANDGDAGFVLTVYKDWICNESIFWDGEGFSRSVTATFSNSATDNSNISAATYPTELGAKEFFLERYEAQKTLFAEISDAMLITDKYNLDGKLGVQYEYTVKRTADSTAAHAMQIAVPCGERMLLITQYSPTDDAYENHADLVAATLSKFKFSTFVAPTPIGGEGMVKITGSLAAFSLSAPATWYNAVLEESDYCKAISPDGKMAVIGMAFLPTIPDNAELNIPNYWELVIRKECEARFGESFAVTEDGEHVKVNFGTIYRYSYHGTEGGQAYYFSQYLFISGYNVFTVSFSSTEPFDPDTGVAKAIIDTYGF